MSPDASTRQLDPEGTRAAILQAARGCFVRHGFAATAMAAIAKDAGVTKSLIHHHFGSKRELWNAVKQELMAGYHQTQTNMLEQPVLCIELLEESIIAYFRFLQRNPDVVRMTSWMAVERDEACTDVFHELNQRGLEVLRTVQAQGLMRADVSAESTLAMFFTLVRGWFAERPLLHDCRNQADQANADEDYLRTVLRVYLDGLKPPATPPT